MTQQSLVNTCQPICTKYLLSEDGDFICDCGCVVEKKQPMEPYDVLDKLCWADIVHLVQGTKEKEDIRFCRGESCNHCGKFNEGLDP